MKGGESEKFGNGGGMTEKMKLPDVICVICKTLPQREETENRSRPQDGNRRVLEDNLVFLKM